MSSRNCFLMFFTTLMFGFLLGFHARALPHVSYVRSIKQEVKDCHAAMNALVLKDVASEQN